MARIEQIPPKSGIPKTKNIFMNREALKLKNAKRKLWKKYYGTNNELDFLNFKNCRDKLRSTTEDRL